MSDENMSDSTGSMQMTNQQWFLKLYKKIEKTEAGLTEKIFDLALTVNTLETKFEDLDCVSGSSVMLAVAQHEKDCRREHKKSNPKTHRPFPPNATAIGNIKNPYTIGAGLIALAGAITAAIQALT